jgi:CBS domain-containing protein
MTDTTTFQGTLNTTSVRDIMKPRQHLTCVDETATTTTILNYLKDHDYLWIIKPNSLHTLTGIITRTNAITLFAKPIDTTTYDHASPISLAYGTDYTAADLMTPRPVTIIKDATLADALTLMKQHKINQLPVVDTNLDILGELTIHHIINLYIHDTNTPHP